jgi:hypothetical protein
MQELLFGSWGPQLLSFGRQNPVQLISAALAVTSVAIALMFGVRGSGSGDAGGCSFGDGDGDGGGCSGD